MNRCDRCSTAVYPEDLRCAVCGLPTPDPGREASGRARARILRCEGCGAAVRYDAKARAPRCAFCGSVMHVETPMDPVEEADRFLPFAVPPERARTALGRWLAGLGWFRPSNLHREATLDTLTPLYWVGWVFDADARVSWTADSNAGTRRASWAPHAGQSDLHLERVLVSASRGLTRRECRDLASAYDLTTARDAPQAPPGTVFERFDVQRSSARRILVEAVAKTAEVEARRSWIPGTRFRNVHVAVLLRGLVHRRYAFPAYVMAYRYRGKLYRAIVHGQDPTRVIGRAPYSIAKIVLVALGVLVLLRLGCRFLAGG